MVNSGSPESFHSAPSLTKTPSACQVDQPALAKSAPELCLFIYRAGLTFLPTIPWPLEPDWTPSSSRKLVGFPASRAQPHAGHNQQVSGQLPCLTCILGFKKSGVPCSFLFNLIIHSLAYPNGLNLEDPLDIIPPSPPPPTRARLRISVTW